MHFVVTREGSKWVRSSKYESRDVQDKYFSQPVVAAALQR